MSRDMLQQVIEEREKVWEQAKTLNDTVLAESRDYTAEENEKYERMSTELDKFEGRIRDLSHKLKQEQEADEARALLDHTPRPTTKAPSEEPDARSVFRGLMEGRVQTYEFMPEVRDLNTSDDSSVIPTSFSNQLYRHLIDLSAIRRTRARVIRTSSGEALTFPKTASFTSVSAVTSEGAAISESEPTFTTMTLNAFKYAALIQVTSEMLTDTNVVGFEGFLSEQAAEALANGSGAHFATGDGSSKPNGIVTAATVGVTGATGNDGEPTADELIDLKYSVIERYRRSAEWQMSDVTWAAVRKLKDSNNNYLVGPIGVAGELTLLGQPVIINPDIADAATSAKSVVYGDHSAYYIRDVGGIQVARSGDFAFNQDLVTFRFLLRTDGDLIDSSAVKTYQGGAS